FDLARRGLLVDAPLAARCPLEVLDRVRDIERAPVEPGLAKRAVEQSTGRPHEGTPGKVLVVAGLLAHEHERRRFRPLTEHALGGVAVERAAAAPAHRLA